MSARHRTAAELEAYVMGALGGSAAEELEAHAAECEECAAALAREARMEMAFEQVAKQAAARPVVEMVARARRAAAYGAAGVVAMAAAVLLWVGAGGAAVHGVAHSSNGRATGAAVGDPGGEGTPVLQSSGRDGAVILDARNDALDGG